MREQMLKVGELRRSVLVFVAVGLTSMLMTGCQGRRDVSTSPVSGTVTIGGKAIAGVEVYFCGEGLVAYGKTDAQGRYTLVQGAVPGENKVYFTKIEGGSQAVSQEDGMDEYQMQMMAQASGKKADIPKQVVPAEFADAVNPKLSFVVPSGGTDSADFKL